MSVKIKKFEGTYHNTVFMRDHDTLGFQFAVEPSGFGLFDFTIAVTDQDKLRTEYVLTANKQSLSTLLTMLHEQINKK